MPVTFTIADGRTFHDDTPLDAEAVKANLDRIINCECRFAPLFGAVSSVDATGNQVILNLSEPAGSVVEVLTDIPGMLASPASFDNEDIDTNPVGSGPFTVREYTDGGIYYDRWDNYFDVENTNWLPPSKSAVSPTTTPASPASSLVSSTSVWRAWGSWPRPRPAGSTS